MRKLLVSGVTSGMGKAFVEYASLQGDQIIPIVRADHKNQYHKKYPEMISLDYAQPSQVVPALESLKSDIDAFLNFAAILPGKSLFESSAEELAELFAINVITPMLICQSIKNKLKKDGIIVLLGSISGFKGSYDDGYAASKGAIHTLVKSLALKFAPDQRVIGVAPGMIEPTRMTDNLIAGRYEETIQTRIPLHKAGNAKDVAKLIYFLTTDVCQFMTGSLIDINGGQYLR